MRFLVLLAASLALVSGCADTIDDCAYYKDAGYCTDFKDQLLEMCPKTCGFCSGGGGGGGDSGSGGDPGTATDPRAAREPESPELCRDTCSTKDCDWYKSQGHCEQFSAVMVMNCASSCGWCGTPLCSPPDFENGWTDFEMMMIPSGAVVNVYCYEGFTNWGADTLTCQSGSLSGEPRCEKVDESSEQGSYKTDCQKAADSALEPSYVDGKFVVPQESTHYVPKCDYSGGFENVQYDAGKGQTFCVDYSGNEVEGTRYSGKMEYVDCTMNSATEYYKRLAEEAAYAAAQASANTYSEDTTYDNYDYNSGGDTSYDNYDYNSGGDTSYDTYDYGADTYDYNSGGDTSYDNYDYGADTYDYNSGGDTSYDNYDYGADTYDYNSGGDTSYDTYDYGADTYDYGGDSASNTDYANTDDYYSGDDSYYYEGGDSSAGGDDSYYTGGDDSYYGGDDSYYGGDDSYYGGDDSYYGGDDSFSGDYYYEGDSSYGGDSYDTNYDTSYESSGDSGYGGDAYYYEGDASYGGDSSSGDDYYYEARYYSDEGDATEEGDAFAEGAVVESIEDVIVEKVAEADAFAEVDAQMGEARRGRRRMRGMKTKRDTESADQ